ncbi:hypothetical protein N8I77_010646 [Diaporthe amygdali]|uniref:Uncharacterized protein n=1 Tax=Phomopsis amygdali TaxID=1214568 RepID=A0AAD9S7R7_PHOAM|nr:hypothetical protein N8I77_010646 [Diaporthe amygdali]
MSTPRVFIARHGETEWSLSGKHTGVTDIPLTADGEKRVRATGRALVGNDRLIVPNKLTHIFVSPRKRAQRTFELLNLGFKDLPWHAHGPAGDAPGLACNARIEITEDIREWDYGDYEGITSAEIRKLRKDQGLSESWDIWRDGCPGGESPEDVTERMDRLIATIRTQYQEPFMQKEHPGKDIHSSNDGTGDVLVVGHGHILRAFAMRWVGKTLQEGPTFLMEAGGVGTLSYEHHSVDEPAILLGGAFVVSGPEHSDEYVNSFLEQVAEIEFVKEQAAINASRKQKSIDQSKPQPDASDADSEGGGASLSNGDAPNLVDSQQVTPLVQAVTTPSDVTQDQEPQVDQAVQATAPSSETAIEARLAELERRLKEVEEKANAAYRLATAAKKNEPDPNSRIDNLKDRRDIRCRWVTRDQKRVLGESGSNSDPAEVLLPAWPDDAGGKKGDTVTADEGEGKGKAPEVPEHTYGVSSTVRASGMPGLWFVDADDKPDGKTPSGEIE